MDIGVSVLPKLPRDAGDRNRTSPFAFTGNKFEFRAVGSSQNIAIPNMVLNAAMADALDYVANELEGATSKGEDLNKAVGKLLTKLVKEHKRIVFNGNGYSDEWQKEAGKRKLLNLKNTVDALTQFVTPEAIKLLDRFKILNEREMHARYEIFLENYNKTINIEGQLMTLMANRYILPAALEYQKQIGQSVAAVKSGGSTSVQGKKLLSTYTKLVDKFKAQTDALAGLLEHSGGSAEKHAKYMRDTVVPAMSALRELGDAIETTVPSSTWPLPTYREMLFIK
jgi:glutamine synthetase